MQCANAVPQLGLAMILSGPPSSATRPQVDYLVTPRVAACMIAGPFLNVLCFTMGAA
jgi:Permease MlaE